MGFLKPLDSNNDDVIETKELANLRRGRGRPAGNQPADREADAKAILERNDSDGDGVVTKDESRPVVECAFDTIDTNGDGRLDLSEIRNSNLRTRTTPPGGGRVGGGGLTPARAREIQLQLSAGAATFLQAEVVRGLRLTEDQKSRIRQITQDTAPKCNDIMTKARAATDVQSRSKLVEQANQMRARSIQQAVNDVLNEDQKKKWKEMLGIPATAEERRSYRQRSQEGRSGPSGPSADTSRAVEQLFSANDADGDDKITPDEARRIVKNSFDEFDQNSDGAVDREEFNTVAPRFIRIPSSGPGPWFDAAQLSQMQDRYWPKLPRPAWQIRDDILPTEELPGEGIWLDPALANVRGTIFPVTVWFDRQFLGDGIAYARRCEEFAGQKREVLRARVVDTLKTLSEQSIQASEKRMRQLADQKHVRLVQWHWIVNGFSCYVTKEGLAGLQTVPGVKNIFLARRRLAGPVTDELHPSFFSMREKATFNPDRFKHPWYTRYLQADKTWRRLGVSGAGTLNVVMDGNFVFSPNVNGNLYRNTGETPGNGLDDDGNGLIDDYHGFNFERDDALLAGPVESDRYGGGNHGFLCAAIICSSGTENSPYEFGLAPAASWAGVIAHSHQERALEWAIEQGADTVSMSFSWPNLGEFRSHWRKMVEQAAFCGVCCVSGAGNFAREGSSSFAPIPIQMRTPEDIPQAVFAPAGVQRNLERTAFSSQGPVKWETEHYREGLVEKPDFCAFNFGLPLLKPDGTTLPTGVNGNSFAGPMAAGTLALMLSADPDLLPWDAREILVETATDVGPPGFDHQTGHGLINCYRAVREVLRRKCVRDGEDPQPYVTPHQTTKWILSA